jgi:cytoskeletal protein CcmA (bactofilin family)
MAEAPLRASEHGQGTSIIGKLLVVKGEVSGDEALVVDGEVEGPVMLPGHRLTVRTNGRIRGNIDARHVILHGRVVGDIEASDRLELFRSGSVEGEVSTARISIEDGALFKGRLDINKPEPDLMIDTKLPVSPAVSVAKTSQLGPLLERGGKKARKESA